MASFSFKQLLIQRGISPEERRSVLEDLFVFGKDNQRPFLIRMSVLMVLSTIIATAGLLSDSAAVVIGAMLVAPMMNPVMAAAGSVVMGWSHRFYASLWLVFLMGIVALANRRWVWRGTQYGSDNTALARQNERYTLQFEDKDKFRLMADCGTLKGSYIFSGRSLDIKMNRNWFSGCRKDKVLKLFVEDLVRSQTAFLEDDTLQIALAGSEGIMFFNQE